MSPRIFRLIDLLLLFLGLSCISAANSSSDITIRCLSCTNQAQKEVVILIHGLNSSSSVWEPSATSLAEITGADIFGVEYQTSILRTDVLPLSRLVTSLASAIDVAPIGGRPITLIGHSQGGILALQYVINRLTRNNVTRLILLGSPLRGSSLADVAPPSAASPQVVDLRTDSEYLFDLRMSLNNLGKQLPQTLAVIGRDDNIVNWTSAFLHLPTVSNIIVDADHSGLSDIRNPQLLDAIQRFMKGLPQQSTYVPDTKSAMIKVCIPGLKKFAAYRHYHVELSPTNEELIRRGFYQLTSPDYSSLPQSPFDLNPSSNISTHVSEEALLIAAGIPVIRTAPLLPQASMPADNQFTSGIWINAPTSSVAHLRGYRGNAILAELDGQRIQHVLQRMGFWRSPGGEHRVKVAEFTIADVVQHFFRIGQQHQESGNGNAPSNKELPVANMGHANCALVDGVAYGTYSGDLMNNFRQMKKMFDVDEIRPNIERVNLPFPVKTEVMSPLMDIVWRLPDLYFVQPIEEKLLKYQPASKVISGLPSPEWLKSDSLWNSFISQGHRAAIGACRENFRLAKEAESNEAIGLSQLRLGQAYLMTDAHTAQTHFEDAINTFALTERGQNRTANLASAYSLLAISYMAQSEPASAVSKLALAKILADDLNPHIASISTLITFSSAVSSFDNNDRPTAEKHLKEFSQGNYDAEYKGLAYILLAEYAINDGNLDDADLLIAKAMSYAEQLAGYIHTTMFARTQLLLGRREYSRGNFIKAKQFLIQGLSICEKSLSPNIPIAKRMRELYSSIEKATEAKQNNSGQTPVATGMVNRGQRVNK